MIDGIPAPGTTSVAASPMIYQGLQEPGCSVMLEMWTAYKQNVYIYIYYVYVNQYMHRHIYIYIHIITQALINIPSDQL